MANAGRGAFAPIVDHPLEEWRSIIDLCLTGVFLTVQLAARVMVNGGSIITISSLNATQPSAGMSAYCAAKAGVVMLTQVAAMELGARDIRVNTIAPGLVQTHATSAFWMVPGVVDEFIENTTLGRFPHAGDVAAMAAPATSRAASAGRCSESTAGHPLSVTRIFRPHSRDSPHLLRDRPTATRRVLAAVVRSSHLQPR